MWVPYFPPCEVNARLTIFSDFVKSRFLLAPPTCDLTNPRRSGDVQPASFLLLSVVCEIPMCLSGDYFLF